MLNELIMRICVFVMVIAVVCLLCFANAVECTISNECLNHDIPSWGHEPRVKIIQDTICKDGSISVLLLVDNVCHNAQARDDALLYTWSIINKVFKNTNAQSVDIYFAIPVMETYNHDSGSLYISRENYNEISKALVVKVQESSNQFEWLQ